MTKSIGKLGLIAIGAMALIAVPRASASAELILSDGTNTVTVTSANCGVGCYSFNGAVGSWNINVTTGTTSPGQSPVMDLNSIDHFGGGTTGNTLTIEFSANGYTPPVAGFLMNIGGTVSAGGTVTAALYGGTTNTLGTLAPQIGTTLSFSNPPIAFSGTGGGYLSGLSANPYALTEVATISFAGGRSGQASFDYSVDTVPEPAGVLLLGTAILFSVSAIRRKLGHNKRA